LHQVGDLLKLNLKFRCQKVKQESQNALTNLRSYMYQYEVIFLFRHPSMHGHYKSPTGGLTAGWRRPIVGGQ